MVSPAGAMPPPRAVLTLPPAGLKIPSERPSTAAAAMAEGVAARPATARKKGVSFMDQLVEAMEDVNQHLNPTASRPATASAAADPSHGALVTVPLPPEGSRRRPASASARAWPSHPRTSPPGSLSCLTLGESTALL
jgi:hypothetical protein